MTTLSDKSASLAADSRRRKSVLSSTSTTIGCFPRSDKWCWEKASTTPSSTSTTAEMSPRLRLRRQPWAADRAPGARLEQIQVDSQSRGLDSGRSVGQSAGRGLTERIRAGSSDGSSTAFDRQQAQQDSHGRTSVPVLVSQA